MGPDEAFRGRERVSPTLCSVGCHVAKQPFMGTISDLTSKVSGLFIEVKFT